MVVVALLSVDLVESVDLVSVVLVVNCICWGSFDLLCPFVGWVRYYLLKSEKHCQVSSYAF